MEKQAELSKEKLQSIKIFLETTSLMNPSVEDISESTGISLDQIDNYLNELNIDVVNDLVEDEINSVESKLYSDDEKKQMLFEYIKKERSIDYLCEKLYITELEVAGIIRELRNDGYNILHAIKNGENVVLNLGNDSLKNTGIHKISNEGEEFSFLAISDTRLCSYYQQLSILNDLYLKAYEEYGAKFVLHCGDISEGLYKDSQYKDTIFAHDTSSQAQYIIDNYPNLYDMKTYFITGEHDDTHIKASKQNIGKIISGEREDMVYLGQNRCLVNVDKTNILMRHPRGKVAYTISYKSQRHIAAMRSEDKVHIILNGHWQYMDEYVRRTINEYAIPSVVAQTPEMDFKETPNTVGGYIINVKLDAKGNFIKTTYSRLPYYETSKFEDYRRVKPLIIEASDEEYKRTLSLRMGDK